MQLTEIYQLTGWIKREIEEAQIVQKFAALFNVLSANAKRPNNQPAQPFEEPKNALIEAITSINVNALTLSQLHVLDTLNINQNIGNNGKNKLNEILANTLDIAHVSQQINTIQIALQNYIVKSALTAILL